MANFDKAIQKTLKNEGIYSFDKSDPGGETYRGISRKKNITWPGWFIVDKAKVCGRFPINLNDNISLDSLVLNLYKKKYWDSILGDSILKQRVAESIFDFSVNAGSRTSVKVAQSVVGVASDGWFGPKTLKSLNKTNSRFFLTNFSISKIKRYIKICKKLPKSKKYFLGWVSRSLSTV